MCGKQMGMLVFLCWPHSSLNCAGSPCSWMPVKELHCNHTLKVLHVLLLFSEHFHEIQTACTCPANVVNPAWGAFL